MKKLLKNAFTLAVLSAAVFCFSACEAEITPAATTTTVVEEVATNSASLEVDLDANVSTKYSSNGAEWGCHDPKLFQDDDGTYYVYSTGWNSGVQLRKSTDLVNWENCSFSLRTYDTEFVNWVGSSGSWAPTVVKQNGKYYMFHGIITGNPPDVHACITLAISETPDGNFLPASQYDSITYKTSTLVRYTWDNTASGYTNTYNNANKSWNNGFGCIDPEFVFDVATGELMTYTIGSNTCYAVTYGSWKQGIAVLYVDAETFKPVCTVAGKSAYNNVTYSIGSEMDAPADSINGNQGTFLVGRNPNSSTDSAYEGAQLIYNSNTKYYYMFVSMGELTYEYRVGVGRAYSANGTSIPTTYKDANGGNMSTVSNSTYHAIGAKIMGAEKLYGENGWRSPGGQSILRTKDGKIMFACHSRTTFNGGSFALRLHQMFFNDDGWPVLNHNDYYDDYAGYTTDGTEGLCRLTLEEIAGTYKTILTERGTAKSELSLDNGTYTGNTADGNATESKSITISSDGTISGSYSGSVSLASNGYTATINLTNYGTFKGYFLYAVDWARKAGSRRTITFTSLCESTSSKAKGEYFWGNKSESVSNTVSYADAYANASLQATYTMTVADTAADDLGWYLYPQLGTWTYVVDDGSGESDPASVSGAGSWWKGSSANKSSSYTIADGGTLTFYISTSNTTCAMILEGYSSTNAAANAGAESAGYADINYHDTDDGWGTAVSAWGTSDSRTAISFDAAQSVKIVITRSGTTQTAKIYKK